MSLETDIGRVTHDVIGAITDATSNNIAVILKNEMNLSEDQIRRVISITKSTIESVGFNGSGQYVSVARKHITESAPATKSKLFG